MEVEKPQDQTQMAGKQGVNIKPESTKWKIGKEKKY